MTESRPSPLRGIWVYFLLSSVLLLFNLLPNLITTRAPTMISKIHLLLVYPSYSVAYMLPMLALSLLALLILSPKLLGRFWKEDSLVPSRLGYAAAFILASVTQVFFFFDAFAYRVFGFHLDGFVWNLLLTPGGIKSMDNSTSTTITFIIIMIVIVGLQLGLLWLSVKSRLAASLGKLASKRVVIGICAGWSVLFVAQLLSYGVSTMRAYSPIFVASKAMPFYAKTSMRSIGRKIGLTVADESVDLRAGKGALQYPLKEIRIKPDHPRYNLIWLTAESWRWNMLTEEIMPNTHAFAKDSVFCKNHYSGGNGTRAGVFTQFYGLHTPYWFTFLGAKRSPVIMDVIQEQGYQMQMYTSAEFSYPEFDQTIFANIPREIMHDNKKIVGWKCDQKWVGEMMKFIDQRDPSKPFMTFMFFESPHAAYGFPPEAEIRKDYSKIVNYATISLDADADRIRNRYINSCHHLDMQFGRVFKFLEERKLLDTTIVVVTGDHGEEFMEKGRWGHNSTFVEEQVRVALILRVPGQKPRVIEGLTSHADVPATVAALLGVENPPSDFCFGKNILAPDFKRDYCVVGDWHNLGFIDMDHKIRMPLTGLSFSMREATDKNDSPLANPEAFIDRDRKYMFQAAQELNLFSR